MTLKHFPWVYYMNICHVGPPWGHSGTHGGPKWPKTALKWSRMAQNHHNGSKWHCMIPNGPNDPKTLPMCILHDYMSCWTTLDPFQRPTGASKLPEKSPRWPKISPKWLFTTPNVLTWPQMALKHFPWVYYLILCHVRPTWGLCRGPWGPQNVPKQHHNGPSWPKLALHDQKWPCNEETSWPKISLHDPKWP